MQAIDSNIFIYALDGAGELSTKAHQLLAKLEQTERFIASHLVIMEVLRKPAEISAETEELARSFLHSFRNLQFIAVDGQVAEIAARLLAAHGKKLKPLDALHLATAMHTGADIFWTNDKTLAELPIKGLRIHLLSVLLTDKQV